MAVWHHSLSNLALAGSVWSTTHNNCLNNGKEPLCPLDEPQSWCGCFEEGKKLLLLLNQTCPAHSVVTIPATLSGVIVTPLTDSPDSDAFAHPTTLPMGGRWKQKIHKTKNNTHG